MFALLLWEVIGGVSKEVETITVVEEIAPPTELKLEKRLREGIRVILKEGKPGLKKVRYEVRYINGKEEKRVLGEKMIRKPQPTIVLQGVGRHLSSRGGIDRVKKVLIMEATAYCAGRGGVDRVTATGIRAEYGIAAVDKRVIKLGTLLYVEGYGLAIAADVGRAIKGNRIDLFMESYAEAKRWGRRKVKVYILE
ncbi:G5 domain-containing protein [bacterium]|nr:G5 domain-containing protein [bacterium]